MITRNSRVQTDQSGFASIVIAIVLVLVLSLVTVGFAQLMQSEQRQALDKQLSSQAYYAAESGVNDAAKAINAGYTKAKTSCDNSPTSVDYSLTGSDYLKSTAVGDETSASYSCLLINPMPPSLEYGSIDNTSRAVEIEGHSSDGTPVAVQTIMISWQEPNGNKTFPTNCNTWYPASGGSQNWTYTGVMRVQLIPLNYLTRAGLTSSSTTAFLCPNSGSGVPGSVDYTTATAASSGVVINGNCSETAKPRYCNAKITNLGGLNQTTFFLDLKGIYSPSAVTVTAYGGDGTVGSANQLNIAGAQTLVDVTGKAEDVLRRIQVRIPTYSGYAIPDGTSGTQSICKQLSLLPGDGVSSSRCPLP
jgi:Tfp pilus assembly protein PilX